MKFRKKPVIIEAIQWDQSLPKNETTREHKGERYPCKPDIFQMTYEPA